MDADATVFHLSAGRSGRGGRDPNLRRDLAMSKRLSAKHKLDRRMGENIWGRPKSPVNRREYGPGQHGQRRKGKLSDFGVQLRAKQKLRGYYANITEKQFRNIYKEASRLRGDTGALLIGLLERRLDALVYRAKFVPTVFSARQIVSHGHVMVNGKRVTVPSYRLEVGDIVQLRDRAKELIIVIEAAQSSEREVPDYIEVDESKKTAKLTRIPTLTEVPYPVQMEPHLVVEYYSR
jgi:small subunit ribosomal protein S4